jgi:glycosyltransferase involved in cell wall biosynthesis
MNVSAEDSGLAGGAGVLGRLLILVNDPTFFCSHRLPVALAAQAAGYEVHIATSAGPAVNSIVRAGFTHHVLPLSRSGLNPFKELLSFLMIFWLMLRLRPKLVHLVTIKPVLYGGLAARIARVPCVVAAVSGLGFIFIAHGVRATVGRWLAGAFYKVALGHGNLKVIFQNPDDRDSLTKLAHIPMGKVVMIRGSGVDLTQFIHNSPPPGLPVVLLAARLLADKGVHEFVQAARLLKQRGLSARFCLVGTVDLANPTSLTNGELAQWASEGVVELWGHRSDMPQVLSAAQVVVLPSYYGEGLPKVLIEAAACGRAVVTTDHPGCRDAVESGISGVLVPVRDADALANALEGLINDPKLCLTMGNAGRSLAERAFDVRQVVAAHLRIYQELIDKS